MNLTSSPAFAVTAAGVTATEVGSTNDSSFTPIVNSTIAETSVPFTVAFTVTLSPSLASSVVVTTPFLSTVAAEPSTLHLEQQPRCLIQKLLQKLLKHHLLQGQVLLLL